MELDEIKELTRYKDERINAAKERLAFEVTKLVHGEEEAKAAQCCARAAFGGCADEMPTLCLDLDENAFVVDIMTAAKAAASKSEARRLIEGGGVKLDEIKVGSVSDTPKSVGAGKTFVLHKGKKVHIKIALK